ncbi:MAG TPA: hypothetical protein QF753_15355 [Victivallales bacterium]|nr:hypothetical protein [Victivallales bacterium]
MDKKYYLPLWISIGFVLFIIILGIIVFVSFNKYNEELKNNYAKKLIAQKKHYINSIKLLETRFGTLLSEKEKLINQLQKQLLSAQRELNNYGKHKEIMLDNADRIKRNYDNQIKLLQDMNGKDNFVKQIHSTVTPNMIQKK